MKYLKGYKIFESNIISKPDLSKVEETFYNISDKLDVKVTSFNIKSLSEYDYDLELYRKSNNGVKVSIKEKENILLDLDNDNDLEKVINFNEIKDDLEFAINYITNELGLNLYAMYIYDKNHELQIISDINSSEIPSDINFINLFFNIKKDQI